MNVDTNAKIQLLHKLSRCSIYNKQNHCLRRTEISLILDDLCNGIKVPQYDWNQVNVFWKHIEEELEYCTDALDLNNFLFIKYPKSMDEFSFWKAYKTIKQIHHRETQLRMMNRLSARKPKATVNIKTQYGKHFNQYKQGQ